MSALLEIRDLQVTHAGRPILDGVDITLERGEALGDGGVRLRQEGHSARADEALPAA